MRVYEGIWEYALLLPLSPCHSPSSLSLSPFPAFISPRWLLLSLPRPLHAVGMLVVHICTVLQGSPRRAQRASAHRISKPWMRSSFHHRRARAMLDRRSIMACMTAAWKRTKVVSKVKCKCKSSSKTKTNTIPKIKTTAKQDSDEDQHEDHSNDQ